MSTPAQNEIGTTGLEHYDGRLDMEWHHALRGRKLAKKIRELHDNSCIVGAYTAATEFLVRKVTLRIDPPEGNDSPEGSQWAQFFREAWTDMVSAPSDVVSNILSSPLYGHVELEKIYKQRRGEQDDPLRTSEYDDGRWGWADFAIRPQETIERWEIDKNGRVKGVYQLAPPYYEETYIPREKLIHVIPRAWRGSPEGRSMIRSAVRTLSHIQSLEDFEVVGVEKCLDGIPDMQLPIECFTSSATEWKQTYNRFVDMIVKLKRGHMAAVARPSELDEDGNPTGYKLGTLGNGNVRLIETDPIIRRKESRALMAMIAEVLVIGLDRHGSHALSETSFGNLFAMFLSVMLDVVCNAVTEQAFPELARLNNCPREHTPILTHPEISGPDLSQLGNFIDMLLRNEVLLPGPKLAESAVSLAGLSQEIAVESWSDKTRGTKLKEDT